MTPTGWTHESGGLMTRLVTWAQAFAVSVGEPGLFPISAADPRYNWSTLDRVAAEV